ncbi:MAG TPA: peptide chain release factor N(5)-glutamine methyltransferase [Holophagaceae bacterium]|nr:peptide chain release factor N(5)-glutamine methyltransferase [Holophagaceae bacterium]
MNALSYADLRRDLAGMLARFLPPGEAVAESWRWMDEGLGHPRSWMLAHGEEPVPGAEREQVGQWIRRRREGEPWSYLLGWAPFRDKRWKVTRDTLIPRPETELVLEAALDVGRRLKVTRAVDIGTGSGILGISLALETEWAVTATDLSPAALSVAKANAGTHGARLTFLEGDLLEPVPDPLELVVSNPPYVAESDRPSLQRELAFEPEMALFSPDAGMDHPTRILAQARSRGARACVLEIGAGQGGELCRRALDMGWAKAMNHQDLAGHDRILIALA